MSFLQQLQEKRLALQATTTIVTTTTGERFMESRTDTTPPIKLENCCYGFIVDTKPDILPACILKEFLYLGSQDAITSDNLKTYNITHILSIGIDISPSVVDNIFSMVQQKFIPCLDLPETQLFEVNGVMQKAMVFIENVRLQHGRVLVHCNAGVSRSASVVIAYLMREQNISFEQAFDLVKSKRECIQPNAGFMRQLKNYKYNSLPNRQF